MHSKGGGGGGGVNEDGANVTLLLLPPIQYMKTDTCTYSVANHHFIPLSKKDVYCTHTCRTVELGVVENQYHINVQVTCNTLKLEIFILNNLCSNAPIPHNISNMNVLS